MVAAPTRQNVIRNVHTIMVNNRDTATRIVTITLVDGSTNPVQVKQALSTGSSLVYETNSGWQVLSPITPPFADSTSLLYNVTDPTKLARFDLSALTTGQTRVYTLPDASGVLALSSGGALTAGRVVYTDTGGLLNASASLTWTGSGTLALTGSQTVSSNFTLSALTTNRVLYTTTAGLVTNSGNLTFDGTTLALTGAQTISSTLNVTGTSTLGVTNTGALSATTGNFSSTLAVTGHTTFEGVTSTGATGTGNLVYSASPTLSGTVGGALTFSGALTLSSALTYGGVTLSNAVTGTGNMVLSASPTLTGTLTAAAANFSGAVSISLAQASLSITSSTGTNEVYTKVINTGGTYYYGVENSAGGAFGAVAAYEALIFTPSGRSLSFMAGGVTQARVVATASATRYITLTGSNGGNSTLGVSAGALAISCNIETAGNLGVNTTADFLLNVKGAANTGFDPAIPIVASLSSNAAYSTSPGAGLHFQNKYNNVGNYAGMGGIVVFKENATDGNYAGYLAVFSRANGASVAEVARFTSAGYFKASNSGTYVGSTQTAHELYRAVDDSAAPVVKITNAAATATNQYGVDLNLSGNPNDRTRYFFSGYGSTNGSNQKVILWSDGGATFTGALTYGGVTLSNAVTGTGSMVLSSSPSLTTPAFTGNPTGTVTSGTYTPTLTSVANVDSTTAYSCQYLQVGTVVTVSGKATIDATTSLTLTRVGVSLPVASNFANDNECGGTCHADISASTSDNGLILADATNDRAEIRYEPINGNSHDFWFTFTYRII
jgi:fibronectin-binding autotransporter adhesin